MLLLLKHPETQSPDSYMQFMKSGISIEVYFIFTYLD